MRTTNIRFVFSIAAIAAIVGCATPQTISIKAVPAEAAISVESEYLGESPAAYSMRDVDDFESLRIVAEIAGYEVATKTVTKKPGGLFPGKVFLQLEPRPVPERPADAVQRSAQPPMDLQRTRAPFPMRFDVECHFDEVR